MTLAAVLGCAMTRAVFSACVSDNIDNPVPSGDVSKEVVIDLDSIVIKPYLQFGASLADVEKYMKENYPDWTDNNPDALNEYQQQEGSTWKKTYTKANRTIKYLFGNASGGSLLLVSYGFNSPISLPAVKAELESKGFTYEGILKFDDYDADVCNLFLSADKTIEVQLSYWAKDGGSWTISFQNLDEYDLQFLVPEDVTKGFVVGLDSIVIKPYLQFGASLADVEKYMKENYADWTYTKDEQQEGALFTTYYKKDDEVIVFTYDNTPAGSLRLATYGFYNTEVSFPTVKAELERNGFIYQGKLNFESLGLTDEYQIFLTTDKSIEVQFCRRSDSWALGFQTFDKDDLNYLVPAN